MERSRGGETISAPLCLILTISNGAQGGHGSRAELRRALGSSTHARLRHLPVSTHPQPRLGPHWGGLSPFLFLLLLPPETQVLVANPQKAQPAADSGTARKETVFRCHNSRANSTCSSPASSRTIRSPGPSVLARFLPSNCPGSGLKLLPGIWGWFLILEIFWGEYFANTSAICGCYENFPWHPRHQSGDAPGCRNVLLASLLMVSVLSS